MARRRRRKPRYRVLKALAVIIFMMVIVLVGALIAKNIIARRQAKVVPVEQTSTSPEEHESDSNIPEQAEELAPTEAPPSEEPDSTPEEPDAGWELRLINGENLVPEDYQVELTQLSNGKSVDARIYPSLQQMFDAARSEGVYPIVREGYRTREEQQALMDEKIAAFEAEGNSHEQAQELAKGWVAIPDTSEHQLGIAVDINGDGANSSSEAVYDWLANNAYKYGFILRYPADKVEITNTQFEPWHYRYVGTEAAGEMHSQGVCLEEYLAD